MSVHSKIPFEGQRLGSARKARNRTARLKSDLQDACIAWNYHKRVASSAQSRGADCDKKVEATK